MSDNTNLAQELEYEKAKLARMKEANALSDENKFWLGVWAIVGAAFIALVVSIAYNPFETARVAEMVKLGKNPLEVKCAVDGNSSNMCAVLAAGRVVELEKQK